MGIKVKKFILTLLQAIKAVLPILGFCYLVTWLALFFDMQLFQEFNAHLGFLPSIVDKITKFSVDVHGSMVPMGYVICAGVSVLIYFALCNLENKLQKAIIADKERQNELKNRIDIDINKVEDQKKERLEHLEVFCGLLNLRLSFYDSSWKNEDELIQLKSEYLKMFKKKLQEKYPEIILQLEEGLFITCYDFSKLHTIIKDIAKLFDVVLKIGQKKYIKTDLLLSFWAENKYADFNLTHEILKKINQLGNYNKVIFSGGVYYHYEKDPVRYFDFVSLGTTRIFNAFGDEDLDLNLVAVKNVK